MRPQKPILLYCADQDLLSATAFALRLHPYDVAAVGSGRDVIRLLGGRNAAFVCCVLIHAEQADPVGRLIHRLLEGPSHVPLLLVDRAGDLAPMRYADMVLYGRNTSMAHILAGLQVLSKCGPGPKHQRASDSRLGLYE